MRRIQYVDEFSLSYSSCVSPMAAWPRRPHGVLRAWNRRIHHMTECGISNIVTVANPLIKRFHYSQGRLADPALKVYQQDHRARCNYRHLQEESSSIATSSILELRPKDLRPTKVYTKRRETGKRVRVAGTVKTTTTRSKGTVSPTLSLVAAINVIHINRSCGRNPVDKQRACRERPREHRTSYHNFKHAGFNPHPTSPLSRSRRWSEVTRLFSGSSTPNPVMDTYLFVAFSTTNARASREAQKGVICC
ncbi:hypothetical protein BDM02DRAFT_1465687 [Thelephora ganbajun]|uniref:Uncharacterized protein n=1 Tax=Thelephora ganbajun TaxID=370292 RepID=A0ACB6ZLC5_THEGA|nr:hypothetical protein BDM02DRAFT_1465687 [Thelephora ganbajun]